MFWNWASAIFRHKCAFVHSKVAHKCRLTWLVIPLQCCTVRASIGHRHCHILLVFLLGLTLQSLEWPGHIDVTTADAVSSSSWHRAVPLVYIELRVHGSMCTQMLTGREKELRQKRLMGSLLSLKFYTSVLFLFYSRFNSTLMLAKDCNTYLIFNVAHNYTLFLVKNNKAKKSDTLWSRKRQCFCYWRFTGKSTRPILLLPCNWSE